jgi:hypothetical protein
MQHASCTVALNGDITYTVHKPDVTVAEIAVLRAIHGADAVRDIQPTYMDKRPHAEERERLTLEYNSAKDHDDVLIVSKVFPSFSQLPVTLKDIGVEIDFTPEPEVEEKPRRGRPPVVKEEAIAE